MISPFKLFARRRYLPVSQTLNNTVEGVVKFWLRSTVIDIAKVQHSVLSRAASRRQRLGIPSSQLLLEGSQTQSGETPLTEKRIHSLTHDFLELYEMNSSVIQLVNMSSYNVQNKTYVLLPQENYSWCVSSVDDRGKLSKTVVTPRQLGHSIEAMFGTVKTDRVLEPELIMALCRHYEMMWNNG